MESGYFFFEEITFLMLNIHYELKLKSNMSYIYANQTLYLCLHIGQRVVLLQQQQLFRQLGGIVVVPDCRTGFPLGRSLSLARAPFDPVGCDRAFLSSSIVRGGKELPDGVSCS